MNVQALPADPEMKGGASEGSPHDESSGDGFETILHGQAAALEQPVPTRQGAGSATPPGSVDWARLQRAGEQLAELGRRLGQIGHTPAGVPADALPSAETGAAQAPPPTLAALGGALAGEGEAVLPQLPPLSEGSLPGAADAAAARLRAPLPDGELSHGSPDSGSDERGRAENRGLGEALRDQPLATGDSASRGFEAALEAHAEARPVVNETSPVPSPLAGTELVAGSSPSFGPTAPAAALPVGSPEEAVPVHVEWLAAKGGGRARFQLHPPNLGSVELSVTVRGSSVDIVVHTQDAAAQAAVAGSRDLLADGLATRDLRIETFDVRSGAAGPSLEGGGLSDDRGSSEARSHTSDASSDGHGRGQPGTRSSSIAASPTTAAEELLAGPPAHLLTDASESVDLHI